MEGERRLLILEQQRKYKGKDGALQGGQGEGQVALLIQGGFNGHLLSLFYNWYCPAKFEM